MNCPRCGLSDAGEVSCARCGVVFAKLLARPAAAAVSAPPDPPTAARGTAWPWAVLGLLSIGGGAAVVMRPGAPPPLAAGAGPTTSAVEADLPPPAFASAPPLPEAAPLELKSQGLSAADRDLARSLAGRLAAAGAAEVQQGEDLLERYPDEADLRRLLQAVLMAAAQRARAEHRLQQGAAWLQRAAALAQDARPWLALVDLLMEDNDWAGAEAAARGAIAIEPRNAWAWNALGYALMRQDRSREAAEALQSALDIQEDPAARALLARVNKGLRDENGMTQQTLSHFNVRYDGQAHEGVGREILRALERHYATLTGTLGHEPAGTIPVILFTGQAYYDASGAPAWSGGAYDTLDGRIRIPVGGLTPSLTPDMDATLIHELTHAFVADRTRGVATRDLHEGLAQYMEGKRSEPILGPEGLRALADGRVPGVWGFYLGALSFVEYLVALRGQGGMNDLLQGMAETGSVDQAFQKVHGRGYQESRRLWRERLRQQYGS